MIKNLYLVRHGETLFNRRNLIQGVVNAPLVLEGVAQALHTKKHYFEENGIEYDHVYNSPEGRCIQTTELLTSIPHQAVVDLHEMCFGKFEGEPTHMGCPPDEFAEFYGTVGGETTAEVQTRMNRALFKIMDDNQNQNVLAVAHGCANEAFAEYWKPYDKVQQKHVLQNCSVLHFEYDTEQKIFSLVDVFNEDYQTEDLQAALATHQALII